MAADAAGVFDLKIQVVCVQNVAIARVVKAVVRHVTDHQYLAIGDQHYVMEEPEISD